MATADDGRAPYQGGGDGGKFRRRPFRRSAQATPYDRPSTALRNNNPSLLTKLVDPASKLIYAGAHRLFGVFRKRLPPIPAQGPPEISEEPQHTSQEAGPNNCVGVSELSPDQGGNSASISAATGISDLEQKLKQKTFTRSEIERLAALLHSRTSESPSHDVEKDGAKHPSTLSPLLRLEASTSGSLKNHGDQRDNFPAASPTSSISSRVLEEEIGSPAELSKAYMGSRPTKFAPSALELSSQAPRQDPTLPNNATGLPKTPVTSVVPKTANSFRVLENGFMTPRSRGRSAIYSMARTPYSKGPPTFRQKEVESDYVHGAASPSLISSQSALGHEGSFGLNKMALKRPSSVLDDGIKFGGPLRRTRQNANLLPQGSSLSKDKRELGFSAFLQPVDASQNLLLMNEPERKVFKTVQENGDTSVHGSGYVSVPMKSTQMATKILQQLERLSPKEKSSGSPLAGLRDKSPTKLTSDMLHGQALRSLEKVDSLKFLPRPQYGQISEGQHHDGFYGTLESAAQSKGKVEENGPRKFPIPRNMLTSMNGNSTVPLKDNAPIVTTADSTLKLPAERPQKRCSFRMSAHEDSLELDDHIHANGHESIPLVENKNLETSLVANKVASPAVIQTPTLPEVTKTTALAEATPALPEVAKIQAQPELKKADDATSPPKTDFGFPDGSVDGEQRTGFNFPTSPLSSTITQPVVLLESTLQMDKVAPQKDSNAFSSSDTSAEKVPPFYFSAMSAGFRPNASSDPQSLCSTSVFNSVTKTDDVKFLVANNDDNGNDQKLENIFGKSVSPSFAVPAATPTTSILLFGSSTKSSNITNVTPASGPSIFSSPAPFPALGTNVNSLFNNSSSNVTSSASTTTVVSTSATITAPSSVFSTSVPAPIFSFGSAVASSTSTGAPTSVAEAPDTNATNEKEPSQISSLPLATTTFAPTTTSSSLFGFSSAAAASTTNNQSQGSFFNIASGSQANTQASVAVTQDVPFQFGSSTTFPASVSTGIPSSISGGSLFASSAPAFGSAPSFGISSVAASSETKSGSSTSGSTAFGSAWLPPKSSAFGSTFSSPSSVFSFGASSTPMPSASSSPIMFGQSNTGASTGSSMFSFTAAGATNSSFPAPSQVQSIFGKSTPVFGAATSSPNNNEQMSMEDNMAEDSMQTPSPFPAFGQAPAAVPSFMFGSATPSPTPTPTPAALSFQFGGQPNQAPSQNPFQASGSVEFNAGGGSFSLGSGGGDKSGRRMVRVKSKNRRK